MGTIMRIWRSGSREPSRACIRTYHRKRMSCSGVLIFLSLVGIACASDDKIDRATLKGAASVCTVVEVADQGHSRVAKDDIQAALEKKLTQAGLSVDKRSTTCLYLNV